jgi:hypothetical protein
MDAGVDAVDAVLPCAMFGFGPPNIMSWSTELYFEIPDHSLPATEAGESAERGMLALFIVIDKLAW